MHHIAVLQKEVIQYLDPKPNENFIDATIDGGGHATIILEKNGPRGEVLGIEIDKQLFRSLKTKDRLVLVNDSYLNLKEIVERKKFRKIAGILFDLGMSSWHLEESGRGFSFLRNEPLDMRYHSQSPLTAKKIVNYYSFVEIEKILREYGQEKFSQRIAKEIIESREIQPLKTTWQLAEIVRKAVPVNYERGRINPATRAFQAIRIAVNDELNNLKKVLPQALEILDKNGRLVIISFHSLEERIVKNFFRENKDFLKILTKKPINPSLEEIKNNPRSRSAKLRAAIKQ